MDTEEQMGPMPEQPDFMPVGGMGVGAPPPPPQMQYGGLSADHILTIRQGGREENYRYNQDPQGQLQIDPYDQGMAQRRMVQAQQAQQLRQGRWTQHDENRLRKLQAARDWAENEFQSKRMHISNFNDVMGQIEAGATPLEIRKEQVQQEKEKRLLEQQVEAHRVGVTQDAEGNIVFKGMTDAAMVPKEIRDKQTGEVVGRLVPNISRKDGLTWQFHEQKPGTTKGETDKEIRTQAEANTFLPKTDPGYADAVEKKFNQLREEHDDKKNAARNPQSAIDDLFKKRQKLIEDADVESMKIKDDTKRADDAKKRNEQISRLNDRIRNLLPDGHPAAAPLQATPVAPPPQAQPSAKPTIPTGLTELKSAAKTSAEILARREAEEKAKADEAAFNERERIRKITGDSQWGGRNR